MNQLQKLFKSLSMTQRIAIPIAALLVIAGMMSFVKWRHESDFRPLFSGMAPEDAAGIVQRLKESGVEHRLSDNGTSVLVPMARVDELRLEMAAAGLPRSGRIGFELFDKTNLGITDFTEHINYRRALEGELERSVRSLSEVAQARVHISFPKDSVFLDSREPAKASVLVELKPGARMSDSNVLAVTNLVASAVEGLNPEFVSLVDMRGNLLSRPKKANLDGQESSDAALEYKHQLEKDLYNKVQLTLAPLLGEEHFRVGISADCDFSTSEQTDETYDPTRSVMTSSQKSEDLSNRGDSSGVPGTASNLPRPTSRPALTPGGVSRRTENNSYETSRTVRQVRVPRGVIKRLSASILMDQEVHWQGTGAKAKRVVTPPDPARVKVIHDIVAGVIGLTPTRGDQLVVESLPFQQNVDLPITEGDNNKPVVPANNLRGFLTTPKGMLAIGVGVLLLGGLVLFLLKGRKKKTKTVTSAARLNAGEAHDKGEATGDAQDTAQLSGARPVLQIPEPGASVESLRQNLREAVTRDPAMAAGVIRTWLSEMES
jgi:flagellar M-ring protein FliF